MLDRHLVSDLSTFAVNTSALYDGQVKAVIANLERRIKKGTYDHALALKLWGYVADSAAQMYVREFKIEGHTTSYGPFDKPTRMAAATEIQSYYNERLGLDG